MSIVKCRLQYRDGRDSGAVTAVAVFPSRPGARNLLDARLARGRRPTPTALKDGLRVLGYAACVVAPEYRSEGLSMAYSISVQRVAPRPLAAVRTNIALKEVPSRFRLFLDQVYAAARGGAIALDGQNVFVYRAGPSGTAEVQFGVGVRAPFAAVGRVEQTETPAGDVATTTHWGDYGGLGAAHDAVVAWCNTEHHMLAGVSWEVYGHWEDDPAKRRTDIFHLLRGVRRTEAGTE